MQFHHRLQALGDRRLAATDGTQQVEDLLLLLESLRGVLEEGDDLLDRLFHAVELAKRGVTADHPIAEEPRQPRIVPGVDEFGVADAREHALGGSRVHRRIGPAQVEIIVERKLFLARCRVVGAVRLQQRAHRFSFARAVRSGSYCRCRAVNARMTRGLVLPSLYDAFPLPQGACQ